MHPVGSYCTDISRCTVNKTLNLKNAVKHARHVLKEAQRTLYIKGDRRSYRYTEAGRKRSTTAQLQGNLMVTTTTMPLHAWTSTILCRDCGNSHTVHTDGLTFLNPILRTSIFKTSRRCVVHCIFQLTTTNSQSSHPEGKQCIVIYYNDFRTLIYSSFVPLGLQIMTSIYEIINWCKELSMDVLVFCNDATLQRYSPNTWLKILSKLTSFFFSRYLCITLRTLKTEEEPVNRGRHIPV